MGFAMSFLLSRRDFIKYTAKKSLVLGGGLYALSGSGFFKRLEAASPVVPFPEDFRTELIRKAPEARYWISTSAGVAHCLTCHQSEQVDGKTGHDHHEEVIKCLLCAQDCMISEGNRGRCRARMNIKGKLHTLVYGHPITTHIDPIEKKPFYHFLPGSQAFSLATAGCPLSCQFCQNWEISQSKPEDFPGEYIPPEKIVSASRSRNVPVIAFTYNEPTVFTEYLLDIAESAQNQGIKSVLISCGFMNEPPLADMCRVLDAIKIDLKGFSEDFYRSVCSAELKPVLRSIKQVATSGIHLEIVNLVVPTLNDSEKMLTSLCDWLMNEVGPDVPVHFTRFHPDYKMLNLPPTPIGTLELAREIALSKGLHYPFVGNVPGHPGNHTYCPSCQKIVIKRSGFFIEENNLDKGMCQFCRTPIAGVWNS